MIQEDDVFSGICLVTQLGIVGWCNTTERVVVLGFLLQEALFVLEKSNKLTGVSLWFYFEMHIQKTWRS